MSMTREGVTGEKKREGRRREGGSREEKEETFLEGKEEDVVVCPFT